MIYPMLKRQPSVKERLELLALRSGPDRDTLLAADRAQEIASRVPRSTLRPVAPPPNPDVDRLLEEFKQECLRDLQLTGHPRAGEAFDLAQALSADGLGQTFQLLEELSRLMVPRDPVTGWIEIEWLAKRVAGVGSRRQRYLATKALVSQLLDRLQEEGDDDEDPTG